jgi:SRSO17 transposase
VRKSATWRPADEDAKWKMRVSDRRATRPGEKKCYLANLPAEIDLRRLAATVKVRWICEQAHLQLKEEFGLDHFEGLS